jgi:hypothetical protein
MDDIKFGTIVNTENAGSLGGENPAAERLRFTRFEVPLGCLNSKTGTGG